MDLIFAHDWGEFRAEVRQFVEDHLPDALRRRVARLEYIDRASHTAWHKRLLAKGWAAPAWPVEHGGAGWSLAKQFVLEQELAAANAPRPIFFGLDMLGPLLIEYGTPMQKERFLPPILSGDEWWCQAFSEPQAGSDLAALRCRAVRDGDVYVVNGTKLWTSQADDSDWMGGLFRTSSDGPKQAGITLLMLPMASAGLDVHPIRSFDGRYEVSQCFFNDVRVPIEYRVGKEHEGWSLAKFMLGVERLGVADVARSLALLARVREISATEIAGGAPLLEDAGFSDELATTRSALLALAATEHEYLFNTDYAAALGAEASALKVLGSTLQQQITELACRAIGYYALPQPRDRGHGDNESSPIPEHTVSLSEAYFNHRKLSIYGGANEVMKNVVAKAVLGLK